MEGTKATVNRLVFKNNLWISGPLKDVRKHLAELALEYSLTGSDRVEDFIRTIDSEANNPAGSDMPTADPA